MAFNTANLARLGGANGFNDYRYDTTDALDTVDDGGYFNNVDDDQKLAIGDTIRVFSWATAVRTGTISQFKHFIVTNVVGGVVSCAEIGISSAGAVSSA